MVNIENGEIETPATLFRYLYYLMYLVPEVPVGPVVPANLISEILVSPPFQKYSTPMVYSEKSIPGRIWQMGAGRREGGHSGPGGSRINL